MDWETLYLQLGQLVAEMPELDTLSPITPEDRRWLGRAAALVREVGFVTDTSTLEVASDHLNTTLRSQNAHAIAAVVYRALAYAEMRAPAAARGAFVGRGNAFDGLKAIRQVLSQATQVALIVDPYMDATVLTDFAVVAPEGVAIRLLTDSASTKPDALQAAAARWAKQFGATRPLEMRMTAPKALHDRLIVADGTLVWSLTQSLKDFAGRSPALVQRVDVELAAAKAAHYRQEWDKGAPIV